MARPRRDAPLEGDEGGSAYRRPGLRFVRRWGRPFAESMVDDSLTGDGRRQAVDLLLREAGVLEVETGDQIMGNSI